MLARTSNENCLNSPERNTYAAFVDELAHFRALLTVQSRIAFVMRRDRAEKIALIEIRRAVSPETASHDSAETRLRAV